MDLTRVLSFLQENGLLNAEQAENSEQAREVLRARQQGDVEQVLLTMGDEGDAAVAEFRRWMQVSDDGSALQRRVSSVGGPSEPESETGRVTIFEVANQEIAFTSPLASFVQTVLLRRDFESRLLASRNVVEIYLNLIGYLLQTPDATSIGLPSDDARVAIVWEALARVDTEVNGGSIHQITTNRNLRQVYAMTSVFLDQYDLNPMAQPALMGNSGEINIPIIYEGQGAVIVQYLNNRLNADGVEGKVARQFYETYKPVLNEALRMHTGNRGFDVDKLRQLNPRDSQNRLAINAVERSLALIDFLRAMDDRIRATYGYSGQTYSEASGQSQGLLGAWAIAGSFGRPEQVPFIPRGAQGFESDEAIRRNILFDAREGYWHQAVSLARWREGMRPAVTIVGIPYDRRDSSSTLARLIDAVNTRVSHQTGRDFFPHIRVSNVVVGEPYFSTFITGTTAGITELERVVSSRDGAGYSADVQGLISSISPEVRIFSWDVLNVTLPAHHPEILEPARDGFVREMKERGIGLLPPQIPVRLNSRPDELIGPDYTGDLLGLHAAENYTNPVFVDEILTNMAADADLIMGGGPGATIPSNVGPKVLGNDGVRVLTMDTDEGRAILTTRDPSMVPRRTEGVVFYVEGEKVRVGERASEAGSTRPVAQAQGPSFEGIDNVTEERRQEEGRTRITVNVRGGVPIEAEERFRTAFMAIGHGPIVRLLSQENLIRDGVKERNHVASLSDAPSSPTDNFTYVWTLSASGEVETLEIAQDGVRSIRLEGSDEDGRIVLHEYTGDDGQTDLIRYYHIQDDGVHELTDGFAERTRQAYAEDWGIKLSEIMNREFGTLPDDLLQQLASEYDIDVTEEQITDFGYQIGIFDDRFTRTAFVKNVIAGQVLLGSMLVRAYGLDMTRVINLGGSERHFAPVGAGRYHVSFTPTSLADINLPEQRLVGRRLTGFIRITRDGRVTDEFDVNLLSRIPVDVQPGGVTNLVPPRTDVTTDFNVYDGFNGIYDEQTINVAAQGFVRFAPDDADTFDVDKNRIHLGNRKMSARLAGLAGPVMQGEKTVAKVNAQVVADLADYDHSLLTDPLSGERANVVATVSEVQFRGFVYPGTTLAYRATRIRQGDGLHEYQVTAFLPETPDSPLLTFTLHLWAEPPVYMFVGQGSQYAGMDADVDADPTRKAHLDAIQTTVNGTDHPVNLREAMQGVSDSKQPGKMLPTTDTALVQPMNSAYNMTFWQERERAGLVHRYGAMFGHSHGEWEALRAAGWIDPQAAIGVITERGHSMGGQVDPSNPQGMRAVINFQGSVAELRGLCATVSQPNAEPSSIVVVANANYPGQLVVSGHVSALDRLETMLEGRMDGYIHVRVSTAFHSPAMAPAVLEMNGYFLREGNPFTQALGGRRVHRVMGDTTGTWLPIDDPEEVAHIMARQVASQVDFIGGTHGLYNAGYREFQEIGPARKPDGGDLTTFVTANLATRGVEPGRDVTVLYANPARGPSTWGEVTRDVIPEREQKVATRDITPPKPRAVVPVTPPAPPGAALGEAEASVQPKPTSDAGAQPVAGPQPPAYREVTVADFRAALWGMSRLGVDADEPTKTGDKPLHGYLTAKAKAIDDVTKDTSLSAVARRMGDELLVPLQPGAIDLLTGDVAYLRGVLGVEGAGLVSSSLYPSDEDIVAVLRRILLELVPAKMERRQNKFDDLIYVGGRLDVGSRGLSFQRVFTVDSTDLLNASFVVSREFGVALMPEDRFWELDKLGESVDLIRERLVRPVVFQKDKLSDQALPVHHTLALRLLAETEALGKLTAQKQKDLDAFEAAKRGAPAAGGGMSAADMEALEGRMADLQRAATTELERKLQSGVRALAAAVGMPIGDETFQEVVLGSDGKLQPPGVAEAAATRKTLDGVTKATSSRFVAQEQPSFDATRAYSFGRVEHNGGPLELIRFIEDLWADTLPEDDKDLRRRANRLANQLDEVRLARVENVHLPETIARFGAESREAVILDYLIRRTRASLHEASEGRGGLFDNVIWIEAYEQVPDYPHRMTRAVRRPMSTDQLIDYYRSLGLSREAIADLRFLTNEGINLYGQEVVMTGAGTIGYPLLAMLLSLGMRVSYIDFMPRTGVEAGVRRSDMFRRLRNTYGVRGLEDQLTVYPQVNLNDPNARALFAHLRDTGHRPVGFLNLAAVSDYGSPKDQGDPHSLMEVYVNFGRVFSALWADYYAGEAKLAVEEGRTPAYDGPFVVTENSTPNEDFMTGTGNYHAMKTPNESGALAKRLHRQGVRYPDGRPIVHVAEVRTPWGNPERDIALGDTANIMSANAARSQTIEQGTSRDHAIHVHNASGTEPAAITLARFVRPFRLQQQGKRVPRSSFAAADFGFLPLALKLERAGGETAGVYMDRMGKEAAARFNAVPRVEARTEALRLPNDGHPIDLNALARRIVVDPEGAEARFNRRVPFAIHPHTPVIFGAGGVSTFDVTAGGTYQALLARTRPTDDRFIDLDKAHLYRRDIHSEARALGKEVTGKSREELEAAYGALVTANTGARHAKDSDNFWTLVAVKVPTSFEVPVPKSMAASFAGWGWTVEHNPTEDVYRARVNAGDEIKIPVKREWPVTVWADVIGGKDGLQWEQYGLAPELQRGTNAYGGYLLRLAVGGALITAGVDAHDLTTRLGQKAIFGSLGLAFTDLAPDIEMTTRPLFNASPINYALADLLGDAGAGQILTEILDAMGAPMDVTAACATGVFNIAVAADHIHAAFEEALLRQIPVGEALRRTGVAGGADYALFYSTVFAFYAVGALHTDENATKHGYAPDERERPGDRDAAGFVPGANSGVVWETNMQNALGNDLIPWTAIIGKDLGTDGAKPKAREMFGEGVYETVAAALRAAQAVIPDPESVIWVVDAHLTSTGGDPFEMGAMGRAFRDVYYLRPGVPVYVVAYKDGLGHGLGGATGIAAAVDQYLIQHRILPGTKNFDNLKEPIGDDPNIVLVNETIDLTRIHGDKPIALVCEGFGFNGKDGAIVLIVPPITVTGRDEAIRILAGQVRTQIQARADIRGEREGGRHLVQYYNDGERHYAVENYRDLWSIYSRSQAIAEILYDRVRTGELRLNFDDPLSWAPRLPQDANIIPTEEDVGMREAFDRLDAIVAGFDRPQVEVLRNAAQTRNTADHVLLFRGISDGMGLRRALALIETGAYRHIVGLYYDAPGSERDYNAQALRAYAAGRGVTLTLINDDAVLSDPTTNQSGVGTNPDIARRYARIRAALDDARTHVSHQDIHVIGSIAWGVPSRQPGKNPISVASINAQGELLMREVGVAANEAEANAKTYNTMGRDNGAWIDQLAADGYLGANSLTTFDDWENGRHQSGEQGLGGVYYGGGTLGEAKTIARDKIAQVRDQHPEWGDQVVLAYPAFMSAALGAIPGGWLFGLVSGRILQDRNEYQNMEALALNSLVGLYTKEREDMTVHVDREEQAIMDEATRVFEEVKGELETWLRANPRAETIPVEASRQILTGRVPEGYEAILNSYLPTDVKRARELASRPAPIHPDLPAVNRKYRSPVIDRHDTFDWDYTANKGWARVSVPGTYQGWQGVVHGGMRNVLFEATMRRVAWKPARYPQGVVYAREFKYLKPTPTGGEVFVVAEQKDHGNFALAIRDSSNGEGTVYDEAAYRPVVLTSKAVGRSTIHVATITDESGGTTIYEIPALAPVKPITLRPDRTFHCLGDCVAAGHDQDTGLNFKYGLDTRKNVLWGSIDPVDGQYTIDMMYLAGDDMGAWTGLRATKNMGYTSTNLYIPIRDPRPNERIFVVSQVPTGQENATNVPADIYFMTASGEVIGLLRVIFYPQERRTLDALRSVLVGVDAHDPEAIATNSFMMDSLGEEYQARVDKLKAEEAAAATANKPKPNRADRTYRTVVIPPRTSSPGTRGQGTAVLPTPSTPNGASQASTTTQITGLAPSGPQMISGSANTLGGRKQFDQLFGYQQGVGITGDAVPLIAADFLEEGSMPPWSSLGALDGMVDLAAANSPVGVPGVQDDSAHDYSALIAQVQSMAQQYGAGNIVDRFGDEAGAADAVSQVDSDNAINDAMSAVSGTTRAQLSRLLHSPQLSDEEKLAVAVMVLRSDPSEYGWIASMADEVAPVPGGSKLGFALIPTTGAQTLAVTGARSAYTPTGVQLSLITRGGR